MPVIQTNDKTFSNEVLTRQEAALYLKCCKTTLDRLNIPKARIRRRIVYRLSILDKWLAEQEAAGRVKV
jgi:hypothetical protein